MIAAVFFSGLDWWIISAGALLLGLSLLLRAYVRAQISWPVRLVCLGLRLAGVVLLCACLLEPLWTRQRAQPGANFFAILADNSEGLQVKDTGETRTRGESLLAVLKPERNKWLPVLEDNFQVRRYLFDARLEGTRDFDELVFDGRSSSMITALRELADRYKGQPFAGILLFTDGIATDARANGGDMSGMPPIYPVVLGNDKPLRDISINKVTIAQTSFEDTPVTIQTEVLHSGFKGDTLVCQLYEVAHASRDGFQISATNRPPSSSTNRLQSGPPRLVSEQTQTAAQTEPVVFRMQVRPKTSGLVFYQVRVAAKNTSLAEATLANNSRMLAVDRGRGPYRILYVGGRPNWEYKFLRRALEEDDQIQLVGLLRIARREPKFEFRGRTGESSNPLFRGFGNQSPEEIERYDQPVLVRLDTRDEFELRGGFPKVPEDLFAYDALIIDDIEAEFFTADQMALAQKFVSERGGGLLMLGGMDTMHHGKYRRTPIGDILPVYLDQALSNPSGPVKLTLVREGWLEPWVRLRNIEEEERERLAGMPPFLVLSPSANLKPGASLLATARDQSGKEFPALAVQRYGSGRTAAVLIGDVWHWGLRDTESHADMDKWWRQFIRWLVSDVPRRVELTAEPIPGDPHGTVRFETRARDKKYEPLDNGATTLSVQYIASISTNGDASTSAPLRLTAEAGSKEAGLYETSFVPRQPGAYYAETAVRDENSAEAGRASAGIAADPAADEFRSLQPNRALLAQLARQTGGQIVNMNDLEQFARNLPHRKVPIMESWNSPLWHRPAVFLLALSCFVAEWGLRRWKGLP